jgi:hypothetical protein
MGKWGGVMESLRLGISSTDQIRHLEAKSQVLRNEKATVLRRFAGE